MERTFEYWQHKTSGEAYAVRFTNEEIDGAWGPLHYTQVTEQNLPYFEYDSEEGEEVGLWVRSLAREFQLKKSRHVA